MSQCLPTNPTNCNPCCVPQPVCDPTNEALASQLNNLITFLIGVLVKSCDDDDNVVWTLPCNLQGGEPVDGYPNTSSSILCYFITVLNAISDIANSSSADISSLTSTVNDLKKRALHGFIDSPSDKDYILMEGAEIVSSITSIKIETLSGTCTVAIQINGAAVTGLGAIAVTAAVQTVTATALNSLVVGDIVKMVVSAGSSPVDLAFSLYYSVT